MILVTGAAGFIGFHVASKLLKEGYQVIGLDNLNSYYDVKLKKSRLEILSKSQNFTFLELHIHKYERLKEECSNFNIEKIVHLAAQAGVRYSIENPKIYIKTNIDEEIIFC